MIPQLCYASILDFTGCVLFSMSSVSHYAKQAANFLPYNEVYKQFFHCELIVII